MKRKHRSSRQMRLATLDRTVKKTCVELNRMWHSFFSPIYSSIHARGSNDRIIYMHPFGANQYLNARCLQSKHGRFGGSIERIPLIAIPPPRHASFTSLAARMHVCPAIRPLSPPRGLVPHRSRRRHLRKQQRRTWPRRRRQTRGCDTGRPCSRRCPRRRMRGLEPPRPRESPWPGSPRFPVRC